MDQQESPAWDMTPQDCNLALMVSYVRDMQEAVHLEEQARTFARSRGIYLETAGRLVALAKARGTDVSTLLAEWEEWEHKEVQDANRRIQAEE